MHLADHIRPLLRDHDCVIIPDFGGLVADVSSARAQPGRQSLSPPTKLVAFNQALTRNDGLLVDALSQHLGMPIAQAREAVRQAVAGLQRELDETNRTELPGIGIFRRAVGRGLAFEYTGTDNLLASSFGLPQLSARPVRANDARVKPPQPALRGAGTRRSRWARFLPGGVIAIAAGLLLLANYQVMLNAGYVPTRWQTQLPQLEWAHRTPTNVAATSEPQQATLGQHDFSATQPIDSEGIMPVEDASVSAAAPEVKPLPSIPAEASAPSSIAPAVGSAATASIPAAAPSAAAPVATKVTAATPAAVSAPMKAAASLATNSLTIKNRTGRFYVIAGAYSSLAHAERGRKAMPRTGNPACIILPHYGSRWFRVTAGDYPDLASAQRAAQRLRVSTHRDYNTLKF